MLWTFLLGALSLFSLVSTVWQWIAGRRFPLHQRVAHAEFAPDVTLLKPVKGADEHTKKCLESWLVQNYGGQVQVLFGVTSKDDPAARLIEQLIREHPGKNIRLVVCGTQLGANAKVAKLIQLEPHASHETIVVSDADVLVPPDFLINAIAPLKDDEVGLVNCFYQLANPVSLAMHWEAVAINADFWSQVLQGMTLAPLDFALGAVMVTRRQNIKAIGGFEALADYLADDYHLGNRIARSGKRIVICPVVVECWDPPQGWAQVWAHQVRWQRTIRVCKPLPYALSLLANPLLWPGLWAILQPGLPSISFLLFSQAVRWLAVGDLLRRNLRHHDSRRVWMATVKDAFQVALWVAAFAGNRIAWRGTTYRITKDGRLQHTAPL